MGPIFQYAVIKGIWSNYLRKCPRCGHQIMVSRRRMKTSQVVCPKCKHSFPWQKD